MIDYSELRGRAKRECLIKGKKVPYDACSTRELNKVKEALKHAFPHYVGSSRILYINGTKQESKELYHFFNR
jgi:hypothetical protein